MNLPNLVIIVLLGVSAIFASLPNGSSQISGDDLSHVDRIIAQGDQAESLLEWLGERRLEYSSLTHHMLLQMLGNHRPKLFKILFQRFTFEHDYVDYNVADLLVVALGLGNIEICDFLLSYKFPLNRNLHVAWSIQYRNESPWDLEGFKKLVLDYPEIAASVCPTPYQSFYKFNAFEVLFLIKFAHFCVALSQNSNKPASFDPTAWIAVVNREHFTTEDRRMLNNCLSELGVKVDRATINSALGNACHPFPFREYRARVLFNTAFIPFADCYSSVFLDSPSKSASPISQEDLLRVDQAIVQRNDPESLDLWFGERYLDYSSIARCRLTAMLHNNQPKLFKCFLGRLDLPYIHRNEILSDLLSVALNFGNVEICDFLLSLNFKYIRSPEGPWRRRFRYGRDLNDLGAFEKLVHDYPEIAAPICPSDDQLYDDYGPYEVEFFFELARFCSKLYGQNPNNPALFNPSAWMKVVNQKRFSKEVRDGLIVKLCFVSTNVDQSIIEKVQRNSLIFYRTYELLRTRDIIGPASPPFPVDDNGIYHPQTTDYERLIEIMFVGAIPDTVFELLRDCRFEPSSFLRRLFLRLISKPNRPIESFYFFFDRIHFVPERTDETFAYLLHFALNTNRMDIFGFLIRQNFKIINQHDFFFNLEIENVQVVQELLLGDAEKAADISPNLRSLQECDDAETAELLIDLASKINPIGFNPSDLLRGLIQNRNIDDATMANLIEHLCKMDAMVEQQTYGLLDQSHPGQDYTKSKETLRYYQEYQKVDIKEPEME